MTVSTTIIKSSHNGNGSTTTFAYNFKIFADTDLVVIIRSAAGTETTKTLTTHYTVAGVGDASGGSITFTSGNIPVSGETVVIRRNVPQTQAIDYIANDPFPAETNEEGLDRTTMIAQQVSEATDRSIKLSRTNTMTSTEFTVGATDRANKILAFDSAGEISVTQELGTYKGTDATTTTEAYVVRDIIKSTTASELNNVYICVADSVVGDLLTDTDHFELLVDAVSAATSATTATTKAAEAATSATNAATSASTATTKASEAATSATNAATSATAADTAKTAAQTAQTAAETALDSFDDTYLGAKSSDPTVDNDGDALKDGALYFDTTNNVLKVYDLGNTQWNRTTPTSGEQTNINTVAGISSNVTTVAGISSNVTTVAGISSDVTTVANDGTDIGTVAGISSDVSSVAGVASNVTTVAGISANVTTVAGISGNVTTVANNDSNITTVAGNNTNITTVAGANSNISTVATDIANVNTTASNITGVNSFAERYRVESSDPSSSLDEGDLVFNTTDNNLKFYNGSAWTAIAPGISNVVDDSSPQLGGNLDLNSNNITGTGNINITGTSNAKSVWESKSSGFTAEAQKSYFVDTSSAALTATLPSSAAIGDEVRFLDVAGTFDTNNLTVGRNSHKIQGDASDLTVSTERAGFALVYYNAAQGWLIKDK